MKPIPEKSSVMAAMQATSDVFLEETTTLNDAIVDAIAAGKVYPGNLVYHNDERIISPELQQQLLERFDKAGWQLYFIIGSPEHPHIHIYIAGEGARYIPVIRQPNSERRTKVKLQSKSAWRSLFSWFLCLF